MSGKVEGLVAKWRELAEKFRDGTDIGNAEAACLVVSANELRAALAADAQSVAAGGEVAVTDEMFDRFVALLIAASWDVDPDGDGRGIEELRAALTAALATQHGDNT